MLRQLGTGDIHATRCLTDDYSSPFVHRYCATSLLHCIYLTYAPRTLYQVFSRLRTWSITVLTANMKHWNSIRAEGRILLPKTDHIRMQILQNLLYTAGKLNHPVRDQPKRTSTVPSKYSSTYEPTSHRTDLTTTMMLNSLRPPYEHPCRPCSPSCQHC